MSRLIGAPPGYVGYDEGGQLTEAVRRKPYSVVLFDEIEKAHPDVFNILLQVLDDGRLTDNKGRTVNFKNTIIIMTSNMGSQYIQSQMEKLNGTNKAQIIEETKREVMNMLKKTIRPEFLNRIDETIMFLPLTEKEIKQIVNLQISNVQKMLAENGVELKLTDAAVNFLAKSGLRSRVRCPSGQACHPTLYAERPLEEVVGTGGGPQQAHRGGCRRQGRRFGIPQLIHIYYIM